MAKEKYIVTVGPRAYSFHDQSTGITVCKGEDKELSRRQYRTQKIQKAIAAGHLIIEETATGVLKPMPISGSDYGSLPENHTYKGVLISTILKSKPFAGIMVRGTVNQNAAFYGIASVLTAAKTALPHIRFTKD